MAKKPQSFKINEKKKEIILYTNVEQNNAEKELIKFYLTSGYSPKMEEKKKSPTVAEMRKQMKSEPNTLELFEKAYKEKNGFHKAMKIYSDFIKRNKTK